MKTIQLFGVLMTLFISLSGHSQAQQPKYKEIKFKVQGVCGMCESRIEKALDQKGIKLADWDLATEECRVVYKTSLYSELEIHQLVANVGHSTDRVEASNESYNSLHGCCKYKEGEKHD